LERPNGIGQVMVGFPFKGVSDGKWCILWKGQSVSTRECWANIAASVADHLGMVFKPHEEAFFQLTTERLAKRGYGTHLETGNPP